jgi:RNA polymerase sigma factor for flagellar operon FliA
MLTDNLQRLQLDGETLVKEFITTGNRGLKEKIIAAYAPLIKHVIGRFNVQYSTTLEREDLYQYGIFGLLKALERYKIEMGVPFRNYAYRRIHGEVVDALRKEGLIGRDKYEQIKTLESTVQKLSSRLGREPYPEEICTEMNITDAEYQSIISASQLIYTTSLNVKIAGDEGDYIYRIDTLVDDEQQSPEDILIRKNLKFNLKKVINNLPDREKLILALYYYEELTLADIARVIGLTEARISQILNKTLLDIRARLS